MEAIDDLETLEHLLEEAAAATAVVMPPIGLPPEIHINRPFLYLIRDIPTGTILFLGRVLDPGSQVPRPANTVAFERAGPAVPRKRGYGKYPPARFVALARQ